jgi:hypothetical protein
MAFKLGSNDPNFYTIYDMAGEHGEAFMPLATQLFSGCEPICAFRLKVRLPFLPLLIYILRRPLN